MRSCYMRMCTTESSEYVVNLFTYSRVIHCHCKVFVLTMHHLRKWIQCFRKWMDSLVATSQLHSPRPLRNECIWIASCSHFKLAHKANVANAFNFASSSCSRRKAPTERQRDREREGRHTRINVHSLHLYVTSPPGSLSPSHSPCPLCHSHSHSLLVPPF